MGISIDPTPPIKKWGGSIKPVIEAVADVIGQSYLDAGFKLHDAIKQARTTDETVHQRAWTLWRESLALALGEFFETAGLTRRPGDKQLKKLLVEVLEGSAKLAERNEVELTGEDLRFPLGFRLYKDVQEKLPGWAREVAPDQSSG